MSKASERKIRSEHILKKYCVPVNHNLPVIEGEGDINLRSTQEVARRAVVLFSIASRAMGERAQDILDFLKREQLWDNATEKEKGFLLNEMASDQELRNYSWRFESVWVLLWALGQVDELEYPSRICDVEKIIKIFSNTSIKGFIASARLRASPEILDEVDLIYRYHWAVIENQLQHIELSSGLDSGVVYERHYSLNWLVNYMDQEWDDITTDT